MQITAHEIRPFANLRYANLHGANLRYANLRNANLHGADLRNANLRYADLRYADLRDANLRYADLRGANLHGADLRGASLYDARLYGVKNIPALAAATLTILPAEGEITGWKKCNNGVLVRLRVPAKARRSNATGRKCRAEYVRVLEVIGAEYGATNKYGPKTEYRVGKLIRCHQWDDNRWNECSGGIHFFLTKEEAEAL